MLVHTVMAQFKVEYSAVPEASAMMSAGASETYRKT